MFAIIWKRNMLCNWDKITYWRIFAQWYKVERENFQMITETSVCDRNFVWRFCPLTSYKWSSLPPQYELGYFLMTRPKLAFNPQPVKIFVIPALSPAHWMLAGLIAALTTSLPRALNKYLFMKLFLHFILTPI